LYLGSENSAPISAPAQMQGTLAEIAENLTKHQIHQ